MNPSFYCRLALALACAAGQPTAQAAPVSASGALIDLGLFAAGSYQLTASGVVDICGGGSALMQPDGRPAALVTCSSVASYFNPNGSYTADNQYGRAGLNAKIGALVGTFNADAYLGTDPSDAQASDWFLIGNAIDLTLTTARHLYASVNDTYYFDNSGAFDVSVRAVNALPEPASLALVVVAGLAAAGRRRLTAQG